MFKNKFKAFFIHFLLSAVAVSLIFLAVVFVWFPSPFLGLTNFKDIATIVIAVDLVLGPLLTFVVFNPKKKSLKKDLAVIVSIQVFALSYGIYTLFLTHPVYIAYHGNAFSMVIAKQATPEKAMYEQLKVSKLSKPTFVYMETNKETRDKLFTETINGGRDIEAHAEFYEPYENHIGTILENSLDAVKLFEEKNLTASSKEFLEEYKERKNDFAYLPLIGTSRNAIIVLDKKTAEIVTTIINDDPWKFAKINKESEKAKNN